MSGRQRDEGGEDTEHPRLFIQHKHGKQCAATRRVFDLTERKASEAGKVPIVTLSSPNRPGFLIVCRHTDLAAVAAEWAQAQAKVRLPSSAGNPGESGGVDEPHV